LQNIALIEEKTGLIAGQPENVKQFLEDYKKFVPQYKSKLTDDYIERALKSQMGELPSGKITNGQGCITNSFMNSTSNAKIYHTGNDINAAVGSEVYSLAEGDIIYARLNQSEGTRTLSGGNIIAIKSKNPTGNTDAIIHRYLHLSQTDVLGLTNAYGPNGNPTNSGNLVHVKAGQIIAKSGSSGTGKPHLHLDIIEMNETDKGLIEDMKAGTLVNPFRKSAPFLDIKNYGICANFFTMDQLTKYDDYQYNAPTIGTWRPVSRSWQHSPGSY